MRDILLYVLTPAITGGAAYGKKQKTRKVTTKKNQTAKRTQVKSNLPTANRKYKDTVFRMLFSDKENLLSLYNAVNRTAYQDSEELEIGGLGFDSGTGSWLACDELWLTRFNGLWVLGSIPWLISFLLKWVFQ